MQMADTGSKMQLGRGVHYGQGYNRGGGRVCDTPSVKEQTQCHTPGAGKASWERGECPKVLLGSVIDFITGVRSH